MKYIKTFKIFERWQSSDFEANKDIYEKELGVNVFDMIMDNIYDLEHQAWLVEKLREYKRSLDKRNMKNRKDILFDKAEMVILVAKNLIESGSNIIYFDTLDELLKRSSSKYSDMESDDYATMIYQNRKWAIFTTENNRLAKYVPHKVKKTYGSQYNDFPWKELKENIDNYPFEAEKNTFIFIINNFDVQESLLLRATWEKDYVLLDYGGEKGDELARESEIEKIYEPLKKKLKVGSIATKVIEWVKENTKFPKYTDIQDATEFMYERLKEDEPKYLYGYFQQDQFIQLFNYNQKGCITAVSNIINNFSTFKLEGKNLYTMTSEFIDYDEFMLKKNVMDFLSDRINSSILIKDLKLNLNFDKKDSENDKYEKIFKYIDKDDYKTLINKYGDEDSFAIFMLYNKETMPVLKNGQIKNEDKIDKDVLENILIYLWGSQWFKEMSEQEWEVEHDANNKWVETTNALMLVFDDAVDRHDMADEITNILPTQEILDYSIEGQEDWWSEISV